MARTRIQWLKEVIKFMDNLPNRERTYICLESAVGRHTHLTHLSEEFSIYTQCTSEEKATFGVIAGKFFKAPTAQEAFDACVYFWSAYYEKGGE